MVYAPPVPPFHLLVKPTGARCNLACAYCFFLSKDQLDPGSAFRMRDDVLKAYAEQLFEAHDGPEVIVAWQGGEPTLMGVDFFRRAIDYIETYRKPHQQVAYTIQTNGTLLDDAWCAFFKEHRFLVGLSLDGPKAIHDAYRVNRGGSGSFDLVLRGWERLQAHGVDVNVLCAVHAANADRPLEVYRFLRDELGARFLQFIPIVERVRSGLEAACISAGARGEGNRPLYAQTGSRVSTRSVTAARFGRFLCTVFDEWVRRDVGAVFVQAFDVALASWMGQHTLCIFSPTCGAGPVLEHNGDVYSCDHYVEPGYLLGNILHTRLAELLACDRQRQFGHDKLSLLPSYCRNCEVVSACYGECPRNRFIDTPDGQPGLNYLCAGYKTFFTHVAEPMAVMADALRRGRPAADVMRWCAAGDALHAASRRVSSVGRNEPCPCGSGRKFKHCHGASAPG